MDGEKEFHEQFDALFRTKNELNNFNFDFYDWGCLRYMLELWIFLGRRRKHGIRSIDRFFGDVLIWLTAKEELRRYDGRDYTAASMITFFLFVKLARMKIEEALAFLSSNKSWMKRIGFEKVPAKGTVTKFRERMGCDFNRFFEDLISCIIDNIDFGDITRFHVVLFTKCYFGNGRFPQISRSIELNKLTRFNDEIQQTATKWAGFDLMLYVLYGLGIVNILEDMKVEKRDNCVFTPLQISILFIVKAILGFKNAYGVDEELEDDLFLQMVCTLDGDRTPSKSTLEDDIKRYKEEELQKAYQTIIQWMGILGFVTGEIVACDSTKLYVDGDTYEKSGEVYDYLKKETTKGYKLFVIYDVVHRIPIYFEVHPMNDADGPKLTKMIEKSMEITGRSIKRMYVDRGFYDETNFVWWGKEKEGKKKIEFVTMGKRGTYLFKEAIELGDDKFREVTLETNEYEPKTSRGKASKRKRDAKKEPVKIADFKSSFSDGSPVRVVVMKKKTQLSNNDKLLLLLEGVSGLYTTREILDLYEQEYGETFSNSKKPVASLTRVLNRISIIEVVGSGRGKKYKIDGYKANIKVMGKNKKETPHIWLTNVFDTSPEQVIEDYRDRWLIETLFEEAKGEWYINKLPGRKLESIKAHLYWSFIAYDIVNIFKRSLTPKYRNAGIEVLRRDLFHKSAVLSFDGESVKLEFNRRYKMRYNEQLASMNEFIDQTRDVIDIL